MHVQGPKFSEQVATLESEVRGLRQSNSKLTEDNKAAAAMIRNKDRELDAAALRVEEAERVMIMNRVRYSWPSVMSRSFTKCWN